MTRHVCFSHGQESGPWGTKIRAMAELARAAGWSVDSIDYQGMDDPLARAAKLVDHCRGLDARPVLVGSSMGGFVALRAAAALPAAGLVMLAPALYLPGYEAHLPAPPDCPMLVIHGWRDDVVPWEGSLRFAAETRARLLLLDGDHRLTGVLEQFLPALGQFLAEIAARDALLAKPR